MICAIYEAKSGVWPRFDMPDALAPAGYAWGTSSIGLRIAWIFGGFACEIMNKLILDTSASRYWIPARRFAAPFEVDEAAGLELPEHLLDLVT